MINRDHPSRPREGRWLMNLPGKFYISVVIDTPTDQEQAEHYAEFLDMIKGSLLGKIVTQDTARMDWLERHSGRFDWSDDEESSDRTIWIEHGNVNDREMRLAGTGPTLRGAIDAAMYLDSSPSESVE